MACVHHGCLIMVEAARMSDGLRRRLAMCRAALAKQQHGEAASKRVIWQKPPCVHPTTAKQCNIKSTLKRLSKAA